MHIAIRSFNNKKGKLITRGTLIPWWKYLFMNEDDKRNFTEESNYLHAIQEEDYKQGWIDYSKIPESTPPAPLNQQEQEDWDHHPHEDFSGAAPIPIVTGADWKQPETDSSQQTEQADGSNHDTGTSNTHSTDIDNGAGMGEAKQ